MANDYFRFKQFMIRQERCAMKVGTDGVLLGAWVGLDGCRKMLDVGTGTGVIALMLAQRKPEATVEAVEIDESAYGQAKENAGDSPFARRIHMIHAPFSDYASQTDSKYDLIVSNPPYFVRSLKNPDPQRRIARHTDSLAVEELIEKAKGLLTKDGRLALILPAGQADELSAIAQSNELSVTRQTLVIPFPGAAPKRILSELSTALSPACTADSLLIADACRQYTTAYVALTRDFYLKMP
ncbi:MAG: methyltransferase [Tannerellaceae bacterium]|jgi:tRNA1Val (adenine37-N6)-methyltransferase|nr:methyltransferase [Tannerellaceae bacterium]